LVGVKAEPVCLLLLPIIFLLRNIHSAMSLLIAHLGPTGTYSEDAALAYAAQCPEPATLCPYANIAQTIQAVVTGASQVGVVPVENSIEGGVTFTLDTLWQLDGLEIQQAIVLPISHALITQATDLTKIQVIYSHPQSLGQCQAWLGQYVPQAQLIPTPSNAEALRYPAQDLSAAAIASQRAAALYNLPVLHLDIQDYPDNCTRFLILAAGQAGNRPQQEHTHTSLAFSVPANVPGALLKPLQIFAQRQLNLSRIESRPSKKAMGDYLFFVDLEINQNPAAVTSALAELAAFADRLKVLGHYRVQSVILKGNP
jgi:prephenate dehydratase